MFFNYDSESLTVVFYIVVDEFLCCCSMIISVVLAGYLCYFMVTMCCFSMIV